MSLYSRVRDIATRVVQRAGYGLAPGSGVQSWLYGANVGLPHEPFAGAWQRNLDQVSGAGPNILAFSAVYSCVNIISSDIARLPVRILRKRLKGGREEYKANPYWRLMRNPNSFQTSLQFVQQYFTSKLINGNTYVLLLRDARGVVSEMYVLNPSRVQVLIAEDGSIFYELTCAPLSGITEQRRIVNPRDIIHDRAATFWHELVGVSPLFAAGVSAMAGARMLINTEKFFANMSRAGGVIVSPNKIDKELAKKLQTEWENNYSRSGLGKVAVLGNGLDFKPLTVNAADSELVTQLRWTVEDVARVYRVPGFKLGDLSKVSYRNSEQMARDYYQGCLSYHLHAYEQCMRRALELPEDVDVEFDLRALFRTETAQRYDSYGKALNAGWMAINEVREEEDLPAVEGGDEPRVQVQYVPLSKANGDGITVPGAPAAPVPTPAPKPPAPTPPKTMGIDADNIQELSRIFARKLMLGGPNAGDRNVT